MDSTYKPLIEYDPSIEYDQSLALSENSLGQYLYKIFPNTTDWVHDKPLLRFRPDYYSESLQMVVEFDGPRHYTESNTIIRDLKKDKLYKSNGITVVRIPYYVQLESRSIDILFGVQTNITQVYPHGFISNNKSLVFPADFCGLGISKFNSDLEKFRGLIAVEIMNNLDGRMHQQGQRPYEYLPPQMLLEYYQHHINSMKLDKDFNQETTEYFIEVTNKILNDPTYSIDTPI